MPIVRIGINPTTSRWTTERRVVCVLCVVCCVSLSICLTRARALSDGRVRAPRVRTSSRWVCVRCVLCDARGSDRGDARTTTRSARLWTTVVTLASVEYTHGATRLYTARVVPNRRNPRAQSQLLNVAHSHCADAKRNSGSTSQLPVHNWSLSPSNVRQSLSSPCGRKT